MDIGINWHQVVGTTPIKLGQLLTLPADEAGNIVWICAGAGNSGTVYVGFNANLSVAITGVPSNTAGWPMSAGQTLPLLTGEGFDVGDSLYAIASGPGQDVYVIGYAPPQGAMAMMAPGGSLLLQTGAFLLLQTGGHVELQT